ncbi:glutamine synthetase family protein [Dictyobacter arantiisoli]|uniref:Glutamine synthetase n=1 Tax=Dictyobacter arantiisoli TaxID=2014874 RepID=A0A5A5THS2_9CHLR|nr:glutamine synthetase family protein [Dictyobacter arantiisoli]GCF10569.1 glutamine synthetase [Dictyobacter arantiisoli]
MNAHEIIEQTQAANIRLVRFLYCDNGGIIRGKATHAYKLASRLHEGIGQTLAMQAFTGVETLASVAEMGPVGEFRLMPDPDTFVILPYLPNTASMLCDMFQLDGQPWGACPRTFLKRTIARLAEQGLQAEVGVEHEFYLARSVNGQYVPADTSGCYSSIGLDEQATVIDAMLAALEVQGFPIELFHTELGPAQQEISLRHANALHAADQVCRVRETIRGVARLSHLYASFAPKPFLDQGGNGAHIHVSLWGTPQRERAQQNLFYDASQPGGLSQMGLYFVGGVLHHLRALVALTCASPNSYRRLLPHFWSSAYGAYGFDNREGAIRIPSLFYGREAESSNLELKCADHSGNPYLAIGALLAAGLDGINQCIDPGQAQKVDPGNYSDREREQLGIRRLPLSLDEALDELERDTVLLDALGPLLATSYIAVKRAEASFFSNKTPEEETLQHFYKY